MRVVLDTNVLVSALLEAEGYPGKNVAAWRRKLYNLIITGSLIAELGRVVQYARIAKRLVGRESDLEELLEDLQALGIPTEGELSLDIMSDPDDNEVLAAAVEGNADYLVTGNKLHFDELEGSYRGVKIVSPREFWEVLQQTEHFP